MKSCPDLYWDMIYSVGFFGAKLLSHSVVSDSMTTWTVACQTPLRMGFSRQEYWSGLPFPSPGDLPYPEIESVSPESSALADMFFTQATWETMIYRICICIFSLKCEKF